MEFSEANLHLIIWVPLILLWGFALVDLFRTPMSGLAKGLWALAIIFVPIFGVIAYFIARPTRTNQYAVDAPGQVGPDQASVDSVARLHDLNQRGVLEDAEFAAYKTYLVR
jgi:Phospholipase_D-nuclease N-terminal